MANEPIVWKSKILLVKTEADYGVDSGPTGALNAILATDVQLQPMEGEDVARNLELPWMGAQSTKKVALRAVLTFTVELAGSGTAGTPPAWGPIIRACGAAQIVTANTSVEYSPVTTGHESVVMHFWIGPSRHIFLGSRGTAVLSVNANGIPVIRFTMTGLFTLPADQARPVVDLSNFKEPEVATKKNTPGFTIGGLPFILRSYELNLGNQVEPRMLIGVERVVIVDKAETMQCTVEAVPYATYNPYAIALNNTLQSVVLQHGIIAGRKATITTPQAEQDRPGGLQNAQNVVEWQLGFKPLPSGTGNDQWKISLT
jgi:hypothetical protein